MDHSNLAMFDSGCQICCKWSRLKPDFKVPAPKNHVADINDTPPSHFKLTMGQPALL